MLNNVRDFAQKLLQAILSSESTAGDGVELAKRQQNAAKTLPKVAQNENSFRLHFLLKKRLATVEAP